MPRNLKDKQPKKMLNTITTMACSISRKLAVGSYKYAKLYFLGGISHESLPSFCHACIKFYVHVLVYTMFIVTVHDILTGSVMDLW